MTPYADLDVHYNIARDMTLVPCKKIIPSGFTAIYTQLAPQNSPHDLVFPGVLWPDNFGPLDLPHVTARTIGERYEGLRQLRRSMVNFIA
jgi:hypothetical protein